MVEYVDKADLFFIVTVEFVQVNFEISWIAQDRLSDKSVNITRVYN